MAKDTAEQQRHRQELLKELGTNSLQVLTIRRRLGKTVQLTMPDFSDGLPVWYFYANDTFNVSCRDLIHIENSQADQSLLVSQGLIINRDSVGSITHVTVLEISNWLYSHHLAELCTLPGLTEKMKTAIARIEEVPIKESELLCGLKL